VAPELIAEQLRRVRKAGRRVRPSSPAAAYHRLRRRCKQLRYALEFFADVYPDAGRPLVRRLIAVQDILGRHQDAEVATERLRHLAREHGAELGPATAFAMGEIAERYRHEMGEERRTFPNAFARVSGKSARTFLAVLEKQRPAPPGPAPGDPVG
jgi:CHAD domain-containing protein